MRKGWIAVVVIVVVIFVAAYAGLIAWLLSRPSAGITPGRGIALIRIEGTVSATGSEEGIFLSLVGTSSEEVVKQLREADSDPDIKAILLRINSPGGTAAAGKEMFIEVKRTKKPVVASIADIGASNAYWAAAPADKIIANPVSAVGSIGVRQTIPSYEKLYEKLGIEYEIIKQGKYKDIGDPARKLTPEEKKILTEQAKVVYEEFVKDVAEGRNLSVAEARELATGLVVPGTQALETRLIDKLGNYQDAVDLAAKLGKIKGKPQIVELGVPSLREVFQNIFRGNTTNVEWLYRLLLLRQEYFSPSSE